MLCKNVGGIDRVVRALIGLGALAAAFTALDAQKGTPLGIAAAAVGAGMLLTAVVGFCPADLPIRLSTCKKP